MSSKFISLSGQAEGFVSLRQYYKSNAADNTAQMAMLKTSVKKAISEELTEKQKNVFLMYYAQEKNIPEIACLLGVNKSTVARHLKAAREKLRRIFRYTFIPINIEEDLRSFPKRF